MDDSAPMEQLGSKLEDIVRGCPEWTGKECSAKGGECNDQTMMIRVAARARNASRSWDLRCEIREKIIQWMCEECPEALPRNRFALAPVGNGEQQPAIPFTSAASAPGSLPYGPFNAPPAWASAAAPAGRAMPDMPPPPPSPFRPL